MAAAAGIAFGVAVWSATRADLAWGYVLFPLLATALVAAADRDGWRIRNLIYGVAIEQRRRRPNLASIRTQRDAETWLASGSNAAAEPLERASALIFAQRGTQAKALLESITPSSDQERSSLARLTAYLEGMTSGTMDIRALEEASASLPEDMRRYQLVAAALSQAVFDVQRRRPWRRSFLATTAEFAAYRLPLRTNSLIAIQEYAAPIAFAAVAIFSWAITPYWTQ